jgi:hypothetical protein
VERTPVLGWTSALIVLALSLSVGCEQRQLTEADCLQVKTRLQKAWHRDAIAASRLSERDEFGKFIGAEGDRIGDSWMDQCSKLVGRPVSAAELDCLSRADTIDDVYECGPR